MVVGGELSVVNPLQTTDLRLFLSLKNMKIKLPVYPTVIVACLLGLVGLLLCLRFSISIERTPPATSSLPTMPEQIPSASIEQSPIVPLPSPVPTSSPDPASVAARQGVLRMSNQTDQAVRVALLVRHLSKHSTGQPTSHPAHWDFAPGEGSRQGLILSLPEGNLKLKPGDILVAFAQDGSRRYWGPYVVGETSSPVWDRQTGEWHLTLQH